jgi:hypothetical protein
MLQADPYMLGHDNCWHFNALSHNVWQTLSSDECCIEWLNKNPLWKMHQKTSKVMNIWTRYLDCQSTYHMQNIQQGRTRVHELQAITARSEEQHEAKHLTKTYDKL